MNSQEMKETLNTKQSEGVENSLASDKQTNVESTVVLNTKSDVIARLEYLLANAKDTNKQELDNLQQHFHKLNLEDLEEQKAKFLADGGSDDQFTPTIDPLNESLRTLVKKIKDARADFLKEDAKVRQENLLRKMAIIDEIKQLLEAPDEANNSFQRFKDLQNEWNDIQKIPHSEARKLWNTYHHYVEQFYDLIKLNNEFREYDFKKNLESKTELCDLAEALDAETNIISAFHQLQKFHKQWREIGPVTKELREEVWERFKNASTVINKKHQDYFEQIKIEEEENFNKKENICKLIEAVKFEELTDYPTWNAATDEVLKLQEEWKTIGFTPKKVNNEVFERYRKACDVFFNTKAEFFKEQKEQIELSIQEKEELCQIAEDNQNRTDWKEATSFFIDLQSKWKDTTPVYRKQSDLLWTRFRGACDHFFAKRNENQASKQQVEVKNLEAKKVVVEKIKALVDSDKKADDVDKEVRELIKEWNAIGHVPFKHKDKAYKVYKDLINKHFDKLSQYISKNRIQNFKVNVENSIEEGDTKSLYREKDRLNRTISRMKGELQTYENNLGFLTLSSKKGNSLLNELNLKVDKLKTDIKILEDKVTIIDNSFDK